VIRPEDVQDFVSENRTINVAIQSKLPPVEDEASGEKVWNNYQPNGNWLGAQIMVPSVDPLEVKPVKPSDSEMLWRELQTSTDTSFSLQPGNVDQRVLRIVFVSDQPAGKFTVHCDGQLLQTRDFASSRGEFKVRVPKTSGVLKAEFESGVRAFVRGAITESSEIWFRRTAMRVNDKPIQFAYQKLTHEDELLTLTLYREDNESSRANISVEIVPEKSVDQMVDNPRESWTIRKREYDVRELQMAPTVLLDRPGRLDAGSRCVFKLGSDLPPGHYNILVHRENSSQGFIRLHQSTIGSGQVRRVGVYDHYEQ